MNTCCAAAALLSSLYNTENILFRFGWNLPGSGWTPASLPNLLLPALAQYRDSAGHDPAVHDVCAVVSVAAPSVFGYTPALVEVETAGRLTSGMTVTSFGADAPNASVATRIDSAAFWNLVLSTYGDLAADMG